MHALHAADLEDVGDDETDRDRIEGSVVLYDIHEDDMPAELAQALATAAPNYSPQYSRTKGTTSWANACVHCGSLQGSFFMHSEPDGPFFGAAEEWTGQPGKVLMDKPVQLEDASYSM